jgi:hypothetical protein
MKLAYFRFSNFIFWISPNLVKYSYGWSPLEQHHKIQMKKKTIELWWTLFYLLTQTCYHWACCIQLELCIPVYYKWQSIDRLMKKQINFLKIKFHMNENIEWHDMDIELNWIKIELKHIQIQFKFNWKEMRSRLVENVLKIYL